MQESMLRREAGLLRAIRRESLRGMWKVYAYRNCGTCREALKWLKARGVAHEVIAIREQAPTVDELSAALAAFGGDVRRLFNTSGGDYRELGLKDRLPSMSAGEACALLASNGNLVKRPFVTGGGAALAGFKPEEWERVFS